MRGILLLVCMAGGYSLGVSLCQGWSLPRSTGDPPPPSPPKPESILALHSIAPTAHDVIAQLWLSYC